MVAISLSVNTRNCRAVLEKNGYFKFSLFYVFYNSIENTLQLAPFIIVNCSNYKQKSFPDFTGRFTSFLIFLWLIILLQRSIKHFIAFLRFFSLLVISIKTIMALTQKNNEQPPREMDCYLLFPYLSWRKKITDYLMESKIGSYFRASSSD